MPTARASSGRWFPLAAIAIFLLAFFLRTTSILNQPLFIDEAYHIIFAHQIAGGDPFAGLQHSRWLNMALLALFRPLGPEGPWIARMLSALAAMLALAACVGLGKSLDRRETGLMAGALYAVLPLAVFLDRQALADPVLAAFTSLSLWAAVIVARRPTLAHGGLLALTLSAANLTKGTALPFLPVPLLASLLLARNGRGRLKGMGMAAAALALAVGAKALLMRLAVQAGFRGVLEFHDTWLVISNSLQNLADLDHIRRQLAPYADINLTYAGPLVVGLALLSLIWIVAGVRRRELLCIAIPALGIGLVYALSNPFNLFGRIEVRHLAPTAGPLAVLAAMSFAAATAWLEKIAYRLYPVISPIKNGRAVGSHLVATGIPVLVGLAIVVLAVRHDALLIATPLDAPHAELDHFSYTSFAEEPKRQLAETILRLRVGDKKLIVLGQLDFVEPYLGPRAGAFYDMEPNIIYPIQIEKRDLPGQLLIWERQGDQQVFFVEHTANLYTLPDHRYGGQWRLIEEIPARRGGVMRLWLLDGIGIDGEQAEALHNAVAAPPGRLPDDERALADALMADLNPRPILVFPSDYAGALAARLSLPLTPLHVPHWPQTPAQASDALAPLLPDEPFQIVEVVIADESRTDPYRAIATALQERLYILDESWYGFLHRLRYVSGPPDLPMEPVAARFEDAIELSEASIIAPESGKMALVALVWRADVPVQDSFKVFGHVYDESGRLVAQHDSVPGNGLFPMTGWIPGESVLDRFAIALPADLPPGAYQVRVGLYHPDSGLRLRVTGGQEVGPDYVVVGTIQIAP